MSNPVEKLIDIENKLDDLALEIDGQSTALDSIDTKVTKIASIDTETIAQGLTLDSIETEQADQGTTLDSIETEQAAQGLSLDSIDTEITDQGTTLDAIETEQAAQGLSLDAIAADTGNAINPLGGWDVNIQDQTTRPIIAKFNQVQNSTNLLSPAVKGAYTIEVTDTTGFVDGRYIILFHPATENFSFYTQLGAPATNTITLDTQIDFAYPAGTYVDAAITDLSVNGSSSPQTFGIRGVGAPPGVDIDVDITRIIFSCIADSVVDLSTFADIAALARGLVLRKRDGAVTNIFNVKTNGEIAGIMYDFNATAALNPQQGTDGFVARLTFGGQSKIGVVVRLPVGDDLELIVQDNLTGITKFEVVAEGHIVD